LRFLFEQKSWRRRSSRRFGHPQLKEQNAKYDENKEHQSDHNRPLSSRHALLTSSAPTANVTLECERQINPETTRGHIASVIDAPHFFADFLVKNCVQAVGAGSLSTLYNVVQVANNCQVGRSRVDVQF
jgi:hypothetical protein